MQDSHTCVASDLHLHSDIAGEIGMDLGFLSRVYSGVQGSCRVVETLVPYLINHIIIFNY